MAKLYDKKNNNRRYNRIKPAIVHYATDIAYDIEGKGGLYDVNVIKQSITNILLTQRSERLFNLGFGTDFYNIIFNRNNTSVTGDMIKEHAIDMVLTYEQRVTINKDQSYAIYNPDSTSIELHLSFTIKATSSNEIWDNTIQL